MIELTPVNIIQILAALEVMFCLGASIDYSYKVRKVFIKLCWLFLVIVNLCSIVK